ELLQPLRVAIEDRLRILDEPGDDRVDHLFAAEVDADARPESGLTHAQVGDAVVATILILSRHVLDVEPRIERLEDADEVDDAQVLVRDVVAAVLRRRALEEVDEGAGAGADVQERAPLQAIAEHLDAPVEHRLEAEDVDDEVEAHARRVAEERAVAQ